MQYIQQHMYCMHTYLHTYKIIYIYINNILLYQLKYVIEGSLEVKRQTSDNMDRWKAETGRVSEEQRRRTKKKRESLRRKKIQVREKVGKSRNTVFFQWFVASEGRKVGSLKRRVRSPLGRWEMKNCTPLWREAHFEVKMYKANHVGTTFGG